jgi:predicted metal-binding transcription factor (methanogenesis marker protein 9)
MGEIHTMPEVDEAVFNPNVEEITFVDDPESFRMAIGAAQMNDQEYIEVGEKLFKYLLKNSKSKFLTYGSPGIKIYLQGTREQLERESKMSAEQYLDYDTKRKMEQQNG